MSKLGKLGKNCSHYTNDIACGRKLEVLVRVMRLAAAAPAAAKLSSPSSYRYSCLLCPRTEHPAIRMRMVLKSEYFIGLSVQHYTLARRLDGLQSRCGCCRESMCLRWKLNSGFPSLSLVTLHWQVVRQEVYLQTGSDGRCKRQDINRMFYRTTANFCALWLRVACCPDTRQPVCAHAYADDLDRSFAKWNRSTNFNGV